MKTEQQKNALPQFTFKTFSDICREAEEHEAEMDSIFEHDSELGYISIHAPNPYHPNERFSPYHIELSRIPDHAGLLEWIHHLTGKDWMTGELVNYFIKRIYEIKGWNLYRNL